MRTELLSSVARLSNQRLIAQVQHLARHGREVTASLVAHLAEFEARKLYLGQGCSSLFSYCVEVLHLSEHEAYVRIKAARLARRFPVVLDKLESGALNLTTLKFLGPVLTAENCERLFAAAGYRSKREVEELVAKVQPKPAVTASIRKVPAARAVSAGAAVPSAAAVTAAATLPVAALPTLPTPPAATATAMNAETANGAQTTVQQEGTAGEPHDVETPPARPVAAAVIAPLSPECYKIQFTASAEMHARLRRAQDLLRHQIPDGDLAAIIDRALTMLVTHLEKTKLGATSRPGRERPRRRGTRYVPPAVRRVVWQRDGGQCAFTSSDGRRCGERGFLEFHHVKPHGDGGEPGVDNIELRCRAHNEYEADLYFGPENKDVRKAAIERRVARRKPVSKPEERKIEEYGPTATQEAARRDASIVKESPAEYVVRSSVGPRSWRSRTRSGTSRCGHVGVVGSLRALAARPCARRGRTRHRDTATPRHRDTATPRHRGKTWGSNRGLADVAWRLQPRGCRLEAAA